MQGRTFTVNTATAGAPSVPVADEASNLREVTFEEYQAFMRSATKAGEDLLADKNEDRRGQGQPRAARA